MEMWGIFFLLPRGKEKMRSAFLVVGEGSQQSESWCHGSKLLAPMRGKAVLETNLIFFVLREYS